MLHSCCLLLFLTSLCTLACSESSWLTRTSRFVSPKGQPLHEKVHPISFVRGGAFNITEMLQRSQTKTSIYEGVSDVIVTTMVGVDMLDRRKKLQLPRNTTVLEVKRQLSAKFPGSPPLALQRLFHSDTLLDDSTIIGSLSTLSPIALELDMITGTSAYNRTMAVTQAIEAYVATLVHQTYLGTKLHELIPAASAVNSSFQSVTPESKAYAELFKSLNDSIYEKYGEEIRLAIEAEKEPDVTSADTAAWRGAVDGSAPVISPLAAALAKEFDLNWRGLRHFTYYTAILLALFFFGATGPASSGALLALIPVLWLSKLRQLRILSKIGLYLVLPEVYQSEFLRPLLPAPLQVIGEQLLAMEQTGAEDDDVTPKQPLQRSGRLKKQRQSSFKTAARLLGTLTGSRVIVKKSVVEDGVRERQYSGAAATLKEVERLVAGLDSWEGSTVDADNDDAVGQQDDGHLVEEEDPVDEAAAHSTADDEDAGKSDNHVDDAQDGSEELDLDEDIDGEDGDADE